MPSTKPGRLFITLTARGADPQSSPTTPFIPSMITSVR